VDHILVDHACSHQVKTVKPELSFKLVKISAIIEIDIKSNKEEANSLKLYQESRRSTAEKINFKPNIENNGDASLSDAALNLSDRKEQERKLFKMQFKAKRDGEWRNRKDAKINRKRRNTLHRYGDKIDKQDRRMPGSYKDQTRVAHRYPDDVSNDKRKRDGRCMEKCEGDMITQEKCRKKLKDEK
jgi:hypothetical protein